MNQPIEMISFCTVNGELRPLRFRYEDETHRLHTVKIAEILVSKEIYYVGLQSYLFVCRAISDGQEKLFELRYNVKGHCWSLFRMIH